MAYGPFGPQDRAPRSQIGFGTVAGAAALDEGLRAYMLRVYNWMASGLALTGLIAYAIAHTRAIDAFYPMVQTAAGYPVHQPSLLAYAAIFSPLVFMLVLSFGVNRLSTRAAQALFWVFCAAMGASLTNIFLVYTQTSIVSVFFITAGTFAAMSIVGYTTKMDLTKFGSFLFMGLIGLLLAMLVNMFLHSPAVSFAISIIGVLVFVGLIAFDTQRIKAGYIQNGYSYGADAAGKRSVYDALSLYMNFINLFLFLLQIFGQRNSR